MDMYQLNQIPSSAQIKKYLRRIIFGKNVFCPQCRSRRVIRYGNRYRCKNCRAKFSLVSHTWLTNMKLDWQQFWILLWCWTTQIPVRQSVSLSKLSEPTVRLWFDRFRSNLPQEYHILEQIIQLDEAFFKKNILMMAKQKDTRKLSYDFIKGTAPQRHHAAYFLYRKVKPGSSLYTDGAGIYRGIEKWWPVKHERDIHSKWQFGKTSEIEGIFGNLRTFIRRMYHHSTPAKLPDYVREFCFRFSSPEIFDNPLGYLEKTLKLVPTC